MKKVLKNNEKTHKYLDSLPKIYIVGCWAKYGVWDFPFTGKYKVKNGVSLPLVYQYDDHNGVADNYYLRTIDWVTSGQILMWTQFKASADRFAQLLNEDYERKQKAQLRKLKREEFKKKYT